MIHSIRLSKVINIFCINTSGQPFGDVVAFKWIVSMMLWIIWNIMKTLMSLGKFKESFQFTEFLILSFKFFSIILVVLPAIENMWHIANCAIIFVDFIFQFRRKIFSVRYAFKSCHRKENHCFMNDGILFSNVHIVIKLLTLLVLSVTPNLHTQQPNVLCAISVVKSVVIAKLIDCITWWNIRVSIKNYNAICAVCGMFWKVTFFVFK